jgi:hypothetical protein
LWIQAHECGSHRSSCGRLTRSEVPIARASTVPYRARIIPWGIARKVPLGARASRCPETSSPSNTPNESPVEAADAVNRLDDSRTGREPPELATCGTVDGYERAVDLSFDTTATRIGPPVEDAAKACGGAVAPSSPPNGPEFRSCV